MNRFELQQELGIGWTQLKIALDECDFAIPGKDEELSPELIDAVRFYHSGGDGAEPVGSKEQPSVPQPFEMEADTASESVDVRDQHRSTVRLRVPSPQATPPSAHSPAASGGAPRHSPGVDPATVANRLLPWDEIAAWHRAKRRKQRKTTGNIGLIGLPKSGKSAYLFVLGRDPQHLDLNGWTLGGRDDRFVRFCFEKDKQLPLWFKTAPEDLPEDTPLFSVVRNAGETNSISRLGAYLRVKLGYDCMDIHSFDAAGETWQRAMVPGEGEFQGVGAFRAINKLRSEVCACDGFIVLLDAFKLYANDNGAETDANLDERILNIMIERLAKLDSGPKGIRLNRPVAFVLNKADWLVANERGPLEGVQLGNFFETFGNLRENHDFVAYNRQRRASLHRRGELAETFFRQVFPDLYALVTNPRYVHVRDSAFFAISCWGHTPQQNPNEGGGGMKATNVGVNIKPIAIEEPLEWILNQVNRRNELRQHGFHGLALIKLLLWVAIALIFFWLGAIALSRFGAGAAARDCNRLARASCFFLAANPFSWGRLLPGSRTVRLGIDRLQAAIALGKIRAESQQPRAAEPPFYRRFDSAFTRAGKIHHSRLRLETVQHLYETFRHRFEGDVMQAIAGNGHALSMLREAKSVLSKGRQAGLLTVEDERVAHRMLAEVERDYLVRKITEWDASRVDTEFGNSLAKLEYFGACGSMLATFRNRVVVAWVDKAERLRANGDIDRALDLLANIPVHALDSERVEIALRWLFSRLTLDKANGVMAPRHIDKARGLLEQWHDLPYRGVFDI